MRKLLILILPLFLFAACVSVNDIATYPSTDGTMLYVFAENTSSREISLCSTDLTVYLNSEYTYSRSVLRYSIGIKNIEKAKLQNLNVELLIGSELVKLNHETVYEKQFKKNGELIRFESELNAEISRRLVENKEPLLMHFYNEDKSFDSTVKLNTFQKKVNLIQRSVL